MHRFDSRVGFFTSLLGLLLLSVSTDATHAQVACDISGDGRCSVEDVDLLVSQIAANDPAADLDADGESNIDDLELFLRRAVNRRNGDFDFLGGVQFSDFLRISDNFGMEAAWSNGDVTADGVVGFADFLLFSTQFGRTEPPLSTSIEVNVSESNGLYTYEYTVSNLPQSPAGLNAIFVDVSDDPGVLDGTQIGLGYFLLSAPDGWRGDYVENSSPIEEVSFISNEGATCVTGLIPGESQTFVLESEYGPGDSEIFLGSLSSTCDHFLATGIQAVVTPQVAPGADIASVPEPNGYNVFCWLLLGFGLFSKRQKTAAKRS